MRVLITGGTGHIGKATAERMLQNGWDVLILDVKTEPEISGAEHVQGDILDYEGLLKHMQGCDAVIHLAAIRSPYLAPADKLFHINVSGTFNIFEAAAVTGIRRVVQASSINAIGAYYNPVEFKPHYFPIDEAHPRFTLDPYSFSKQVVEDMGAYYWRREGISSVAMRFPGVYGAGYVDSANFRQKRDAVHQLLDELVSLPEAEREARLADVKRRTAEFRKGRPFEFGSELERPFENPMFEDALFRTYASDRFNLWAFVDVRDAAQSLEKGVTANYEGAHDLFINDPHNFIDYDARTLIRLFFPDVSDIQGDISGSAALVSIERARALLGFEPEFTIGMSANA